MATNGKSEREVANQRALTLAGTPALIPPPTRRVTTKLTTDDPFWGDQPAILLHTARLIEFFPSADQTLEERMNSITRLVIYVAIFLAVYHAQFAPLQIGGLILAAIYAMWRNQTVVRTEGFNGQLCTPPTLENPMMNFLPGDSPDKPAACRGPETQAEAEQLLGYQLFEDVEDLYSRAASQRQFVTNPVTTNVPDTKGFASYLYGDVKTCKGDGFCPPWVDPRSHRGLIPEDIDREALELAYGA